MIDILDSAPAEVREKARKASPPDWVDPTLATLWKRPFSDPGWIFERKLDGVRCLVLRDADGVRMKSRSGRLQNDTYPELVEAAEAAADNTFVADGEIVAFQGRVTSFQRLQKRSGLTDPEEARHSGVGVKLYLFDLLFLGGYDLRACPLRARKSLLRGALAFGDPLRFTPHRNEAGRSTYAEACRKGWEGVIAKRADSVYTGVRTRDWLKLKCTGRQEFVIGGYTAPEGSRTGFGALAVGVYDDGKLRYAGKVGTGFDEETLGSLHDRLKELARANSPFVDAPKDIDRWVKPELVCEVAYTEWTRGGRLRHPSFVGLRNDKGPEDVTRERAGE